MDLKVKRDLMPMVTSITDLPKVISLLPVQGAALFPRGHLPLPIMTSKHFSLMSEVWQTNKYIGIVQLNHDQTDDPTIPALFSSGTVGKVTEISEFEEGKLFANILGVCRFDVIREVESSPLIRRAEVSYDTYQADLVSEVDFNFDRKKLINELATYFKRFDIDADWDEITSISDDRLITTLAMACPFTQGERQAILQCISIKEQSQMLTSFIEMANMETNPFSITCH